MRLFPTPQYKDVPELLDTPGIASRQDLEASLRDIRRANIFGLGTWVVKHHLSGILANIPRDRVVTVLDLATGSADIPEELCRWGRRTGRHFKITATDVSEEILLVARERIKSAGFAAQVDFLLCDASAAPFQDEAFDIVICSLAFHHLSVQQANTALSRMGRIARYGFIINDIYRSRGAWYMARLLTFVTTRNRLTRHDGPASVLRAFTPRELRVMSRRSGVDVAIHTHPFWRVAVVGRREE